METLRNAVNCPNLEQFEKEEKGLGKWEMGVGGNLIFATAVIYRARRSHPVPFGVASKSQDSSVGTNFVFW